MPENLNLDPHLSCKKPGSVVHTCNSRAKEVVTNTGRFQGLTGQPIYPKWWAVGSGKDPILNNKAEIARRKHSILFCGLHHECTCRSDLHTQTHTLLEIARRKWTLIKGGYTPNTTAKIMPLNVDPTVTTSDMSHSRSIRTSMGHWVLLPSPTLLKAKAVVLCCSSWATRQPAPFPHQKSRTGDSCSCARVPCIKEDKEMGCLAL